jgi:integrase/recombinase XerD
MRRTIVVSRPFRRAIARQAHIEDVREYQLHLASCGLKVRTTNVIMCALRFFYGTTLGKLNVSEHILLARTEDSLPAVLAVAAVDVSCVLTCELNCSNITQD